MAWTGDVVQLQADNPKLGYVLPDTGHMLWSDNFLIPNKAQHKKNAETLINYYYDPEVMAHGRGLRQLHLPGRGHQGGPGRRSTRTSPNNPLIFPDDATLAQVPRVQGLTAEEETKYNQRSRS